MEPYRTLKNNYMEKIKLNNKKKLHGKYYYKLKRMRQQLLYTK